MAKILSKLHFFILLWVVYSVFDKYESHSTKITEIQNRIPIIKNKIKRKNKELKDLQRFLKDVEKAKKMIEKVAQENERIQRQFPSRINDSENLGMVSSMVNRLNILDLKLTPKEEENKGFYFIKRYNLKATGTFLQFLILLEKIGEKKDKLMNIGDLTFKKSNIKNKGRYQLIDVDMNLLVYRYNNNFKEDRGIDKIEKEIKNKKTKRKKPKKSS
tara:strand:+ start:256 stop:903 length:648 start_codon:yes stop_codon:yes gene_type:complete